jgi:hypothetical protein
MFPATVYLDDANPASDFDIYAKARLGFCGTVEGKARENQQDGVGGVGDGHKGARVA